MGFSSLSFTQRLSGLEGSDGCEIRALVAKQLEIDVARVRDEAHFRRDLGAHWLDRLELLMLIEDQFADLEILDGDSEQIEVVGDLIRHIEGARRRGRVARLIDSEVALASA